MKRLIIILILTCAWTYSQAQVNIITTIAGNGIGGYCCDGGSATNANLSFPVAVCLDNLGNLYIVDAGNNRIRRLNISTGIITTVAGNGTNAYFGDGGPATDAQLSVPDAVCTDIFGNVYIADALNYRIRKITLSTGIITTIAGIGISGSTGDNGAATNAELNVISGLHVDNSGNVYMADNNNNKIRKIEVSTGIITTIAGTGIAGYNGDLGAATNAQLNGPGQPFLDNSGNILFTDLVNHVVRKIDGSTGIITTIAGNGTAGYSGDGGAAINAKLNQPYGIFIDSMNNIFIAEWGNGVIRKIDGLTGIISTVAGTGIQGYSGDGGPATNAKLIPDGVCLDGNGTLYIADIDNHRIRVVYNPQLGMPLDELREDVKVYPNPANDELNVTGITESTSYRLLNLTGTCVVKGVLQHGNNTVSMQKTIPGIYILEIADAVGHRINVRVIKN